MLHARLTKHITILVMTRDGLKICLKLNIAIPNKNVNKFNLNQGFH